jgi:hypothetical protein
MPVHGVEVEQGVEDGVDGEPLALGADEGAFVDRMEPRAEQPVKPNSVCTSFGECGLKVGVVTARNAASWVALSRRYRTWCPQLGNRACVSKLRAVHQPRAAS